MSSELPDTEHIQLLLKDSITECLRACITGVYTTKLSFEASIEVQLDNHQQFMLNIQNEVTHSNEDEETTQIVEESDQIQPLLEQIKLELTDVVGDIPQSSSYKPRQVYSPSQGQTTTERRSKRLSSKLKNKQTPSWLRQSHSSKDEELIIKRKKFTKKILPKDATGNDGVIDSNSASLLESSQQPDPGLNSDDPNYPDFMEVKVQKDPNTESSVDDSNIITSFSCPQCDEFFTNKQNLRKHALEVHERIKNAKTDSKLIKCLLCDYTSDWSGNIKRHIRRAHLAKTKCSFCAEEMDDDDSLRQHILDEHPGHQIECKICLKKCRSFTGLQLHISSCHTNENSDRKPLKCPGCYYTTKKPETLAKHMLPVSCDHCEKNNFSCVNEVKAHMKKAHGSCPNVRQVNVCQFCGKEYKSKNGYYAHRRLAHPEKVASTKRVGNKSNVCHICGKDFPIREYLKTHLRYHKDQKRFECPKCHCQFKYRSGFKNHTEGCLNESGFPCEVCGKAYKNEYTLRLHIRHKHIRDTFACRLCNKLFTYRDPRNRHEKICDGNMVGTTPEMQNIPADILAHQKKVTVDYRAKFGKNSTLDIGHEPAVSKLQPQEQKPNIVKGDLHEQSSKMECEEKQEVQEQTSMIIYEEAQEGNLSEHIVDVNLLPFTDTPPVYNAEVILSAITGTVIL